jgi:lipoate-protein ligase A
VGGPLDWEVEERHEAPSAFHARSLPDDGRRQAWVCRPDRPALVLGSAQRDDVVDGQACAEAGIEVVRRRSGGGAVLVVPGELLWVDVLLPAGDPLWRADVGRAFHWLGDVWQAALADLGVGATVHRGPLQRTPWSPLVCFAGLGPGEVCLTGPATGGTPKAVGISQRRTRTTARFQCAALLRWAPAELGRLLALPAEDRDHLVQDVGPVAAAVPVEHDRLLDALVRHLPSS